MGHAHGITILLFLATIFVSVYVTTLLKRYFPGRVWIGSILAPFCAFGPIDQFYLTGGLLYFVALLLIFIMWTIYFGPKISIVIAVSILSGVVMWYRFRRDAVSSEKGLTQ
jgi:hypothetical protein